MNKKKGLICLLILIFLIQIATPVGFIAYRKGLDSKLLENGTDYKFSVKIRSITNGEIYYELTDGWSGMLYDLIYMEDSNRRNTTAYTSIFTDENGFSALGYPETNPGDAPYIKLNSNEQNVFPLQRDFQITSDVSYIAFDTKHTDDVIQNAHFYVTVRVYEGKAIVMGLYEESGQPVDDWISEREQTIAAWSYQYSSAAWNARFSTVGDA